jgi:hypothetical protein
MIYSDSSFSPDSPNKCEGRCNKRDFLLLFKRFFFHLGLNKAFWLNLFRSAHLLKDKAGRDLAPTMTVLWSQSQMWVILT